EAGSNDGLISRIRDEVTLRDSIYTYDFLRRLTSYQMHRTGAPSTVLDSESYTLDVFGNNRMPGLPAGTDVDADHNRLTRGAEMVYDVGSGWKTRHSVVSKNIQGVALAVEDSRGRSGAVHLVAG